NILRALPEVAVASNGRPLASPEMVVLANIRRLGQVGSSNVTLRGVDQEAFALRDQVKILAGRMFRPGTDEVIVGDRIARRFAGCKIGDRLRFNRHDFTVVGQFTAGGARFPSGIWGRNAVLSARMGPPPA